jgi:hypothetical protein
MPGVPFDEMPEQDKEDGDERGPYVYLPPERRLALQREMNRLMSELMRRLAPTATLSPHDPTEKK